MKKKIIFVGLCLFIGSLFFLKYSSKKTTKLPSYSYELAVCAIFKNEAPWLKEWIEYHHKILKVEHFYLYNNDSQDDYEAVLAPYIQKGLVELIQWETTSEGHALHGD